jgi:glycosyltransferase involved in cell wall biosynthesis
MPGKPKTFIVLIPGFPADEADSNCLPFQQSFTRKLALLYPELTIRVIAFQYPFKKSTYQWNNCSVTSFNGRNKGGIRKLLLRRKILQYLSRLHREETIIGLLSCWLGEAAAVGKTFARQKGLPHYCWLMGQDARAGNPYVRKFAFNGNELICLSDALQQELKKNYGLTAAATVYPGIDPDVFSPRTLTRDIDILAAGSLIALKQFNLLIETVKELVPLHPALKVVLCGRGPEEQRLKKAIAEAGLQKIILLTGEIPHTELLLLMQRSRIFLHPSSYEGFSGVCMEALYAGCRVISFTRAVNQEVENWSVVNDLPAMKEQTKILLAAPENTKKMMISNIDTTVKEIMQLFIH